MLIAILIIFLILFLLILFSFSSNQKEYYSIIGEYNIYLNLYSTLYLTNFKDEKLKLLEKRILSLQKSIKKIKGEETYNTLKNHFSSLKETLDSVVNNSEMRTLYIKKLFVDQCELKI